MNFIGAFSGNILYYVTTIFFLIFSIYYQLKKAKLPDEYTVHKINPDIHLMCELLVTVKLYRAACSLCEGASHYFLNSSSHILLNICTND